MYKRQALTYAKSLKNGPTILLDHADNVGSGGTQDVMTVIEEVLNAGLEDVAVAAVYDPEAVNLMAEAGVGREISLDLGGKADMPSINKKGKPLRLKGIVKTLTNGEWIVRGPMYTGVKVSMGNTAVLEVEGIEICLLYTSPSPRDFG